MKKLSSEVPFGWKRKKGAFFMIDREQWVLKRIFEEKKSGKSLEDISQDLMKLGVRPRNGGEWFPRRIKKILTENEELCRATGDQSWIVSEPIAENSSDTKITCSYPYRDSMTIAHFRPGMMVYEIKERREALEKSESEAEQRSVEIGKIITHALFHTVTEIKEE